MFFLVLVTTVSIGFVCLKNIDTTDIRKVHGAFLDIGCKNTVIPFLNLPNSVVSWLETFKFYFSESILRLDQFFRRTLINRNDGTYLIQFYVDSKQYKLIIKPIRGPPLDLEIIDNQTGKNIVSEVEPYIRGEQSLITPTPGILGFNELVFKKDEKERKKVQVNDIIFESFLNYR